MAFYTILFGILFTGSVQLLFHSLLNGEWVTSVFGAILTLLVTNDILYTTSLSERKVIKYDVKYVRIDLLNFFILSFGLVVISPFGNILTIDNFLGLDQNLPPREMLPDIEKRECAFWLSLMVYTGISIYWNRKAKLYRLNVLQYILLFLYLLMLLLSFFAQNQKITLFARVLVLIILISFIFILKPLILNKDKSLLVK